jgi:transcriptional regulator with XRE-family HTH domain
VSAPYKDIAERLGKLLHAYDLTQSAFARRIKVTPHTLNGWLTGERRPGIDTALIIRDEFHCPLDYLYAGDTSTLSVKLHSAIRHGKKLKDL